MADVNDPKFSDWLRRVFGATERLGLSILDDVLPVAPLVDPSAIETLLLRGQRPWQGGINSPAAVGNLSFARLENPATQGNRLVIIEKIFVGTSPNSFVRIATAKSVGVGAVAGDRRPRDGRAVSDTTVSGIDLRQGSRAASLAIGIKTGFTGNQVFDFGAVLPEGWSIDVELGSVNQAFDAGFLFSVRYMEPSESIA